jgi:histidine triad (HIT) family protein
MPEQMNEEDVAALQEKIKNMSPEELREFQKKQCIFCHIVSGRVQAKKIYEDDKTVAVLDINPANPGHILLLPKEHYAIMPQLPEDELGHIFMVAKYLSNSALKALEASGTNIIVANGPAAGQKAQHFMVHIIPRKENDNISFSIPQQKIPEKDLEIIGDKLSKKMQASPSAKIEEIPPALKRLQQEQENNIVEAEFKEETKVKPIKRAHMPKMAVGSISGKGHLGTPKSPQFEEEPKVASVKRPAARQIPSEMSKIQSNAAFDITDHSAKVGRITVERKKPAPEEIKNPLGESTIEPQLTPEVIENKKKIVKKEVNVKRKQTTKVVTKKSVKRKYVESQKKSKQDIKTKTSVSKETLSEKQSDSKNTVPKKEPSANLDDIAHLLGVK